LPLSAQPPHLEFVHGLRSRGYPDLALEYLDRLGQKPLPPEVTRALPLEKAKSRCDMAELEPDPMRRDALYRLAREDIQALVAQNRDSHLGAEAALEDARVVALQGTRLLAQAQRLDRAGGRRPLMDRARALFAEAAQRFRESAALINAQLAKPDVSEADRRSLTLAGEQAELETGINLVRTFLAFDDQFSKERGEIVKQALAALRKVADAKTGPAAPMARAWMGRLFCETDDARSARKELDAVIDDRSPHSDAARRLARAVRLQVVGKDDTRDPVAVKCREAEQWLKDYPAHYHSGEGLEVRFRLAEACLDLGGARRPAEARPLLDRAEQLLEELEKTDSAFARPARERRLQLIYRRSAERTRGDIAQLKDFQECWLRAQVEMYQRSQEEKEPPKGIPPEEAGKRRQQRLKDLAAALDRALDLADAQTPAAERNEGQMVLAFLCLAELDDAYRAALLGEDLARRDPRWTQAATAAGYALQAYGQILAETYKGEGWSPASESDQERVRRLAEYMEKTWPGDPATDGARFQLAAIAVRRRDYPKAIERLSQISVGYGPFTLAQFQLAYAAKQAHKAGLTPPTGQPPYLEQATAALKRIPELSPDADEPTAQAYFYGKLELAQLLFTTRQFDELTKLTEQLNQAFAAAKGKLGGEAAAEVEPTLRVLPAYAEYGRAHSHCEAGRYDQALEILGPLLQRLGGKDRSAVKDPAVLRAIYGLAVRAHIEKGSGQQALEMLRGLPQAGGEQEPVTAPAVLGDVVTELVARAEALRRQGPAAQGALEQLAARLSEFLDGAGRSAAGQPPPEVLQTLAAGFAGLQMHAQAAELLAQIPAPAAGPANADPQRQEPFQHTQLALARELRLARRFEPARVKLREILRSDWGKHSLDARKELNYLWEDEGNFAAAAKGWNDLLTTVRPLTAARKVAGSGEGGGPATEENPRFKELYYECYYHVVLCLCRHARNLTDPKQQRDSMAKAAGWYVNLKKAKDDLGGPGLRARYEQLLAAEPMFRDACEELQKNGRP
jgi:hypothetical protein